ncbi:MAG: transposase [bacterium]|nr:transposase [bacterium]
MPSRNVVKNYLPDSYYHLFNQGVNARKIFKDETDYHTFIEILSRYLSPGPQTDKYGRLLQNLSEDVELQTYTLLPDQFHLLVYTTDGRKISEIIRRVCTAYTAYFNKRHKRKGHLFQGPFKASRVDAGDDLVLLSRYIHRLPRDYHKWHHSSLQHFIGDKKTLWVKPDRIYTMYEWGTYGSYLRDDKDYKESLKKVRSELSAD